MAQCAVEVDPRGRIRMPARFIKGVEWINAPASASDALEILDEPGRIVLLSWNKYGLQFSEKRQELIGAAENSAEAREALIMLEDRYQQRKIPADLRPTLTIEALLHLNIPVETKTHVFLRRVFDAIEIVSVDFRNQQRMRRTDLLDGLP